MNELENMFKTRLKNEVYMNPNTILKIKNLREETLNELKEYFETNFVSFSHINSELIKQITAFDRKTEIKRENYAVELFINFNHMEFKNEQYTPQILLQHITKALKESEYDIHRKIVKKTENNITLNVIPCITFPKEYYLLPNTEETWRKLEYEKMDSINDARMRDAIFILKHWTRCQGFNDEDIDKFIETSVKEYYDKNTKNTYLYLDFNKLLKYISENKNSISEKFNDLKEDFNDVLKENIALSENMIKSDDDKSIICFEKIFGKSYMQ